MKKEPKISIIVPVYNAEKYLEECLNSLIEQSYKNIEILCINDGSKDNSYSILQKYAQKDKRIIVFSQENSGPAMARNLGLANANGEYLMFCDSDDSYEPTMCEEMLKTIHGSDYDFVMCDANIVEVDKGTRPVDVVAYNLANFFGKIDLTDSLKTKIQCILWNKIFRMSVVRKYDITFPNGFEMDDDAFIFQYLASSQKIFGLKTKLYNYKLVSTGIMANYFTLNKSKKVFDVVYAYSHALNKIMQNELLEDSLPWFINRLNNKIKWVFKLLDKKTVWAFLKEVNVCILKFISLSDLRAYPLLVLTKKKCYKEALYLYNGVKYKNYLNLLVVKKSAYKDSVYFAGCQIFKKVKTQAFNKYYIFGIQYRKKDKSLQSWSELRGYLNYLSRSVSNEIKRAVSTAVLHQKTFCGCKNKYHDSDVVLVGGGPTVNNFTPLNNAIYVGLNRAFLREDISFDHLFAVDKIGIEKFIPELQEYSKKTELFIGDINCGKEFQISESMALKLNAKRYNTGNIMNQRVEHVFALDIETQSLGAFHSVAFQAMQFILYTNPKRIYLVGIDCGNAGKHFGGAEHNVADRGENIDKLQQIQINEWKQLKEFADMYYPETEIISINPVGLKYLFTDVYTKSYVEEHPEFNFKNENILEEI